MGARSSVWRSVGGIDANGLGAKGANSSHQSQVVFAI